mmetsp:Transcript_49603/g.118175  ORF Transcript_49603/g.118175 Transcript_49603/m.118175 type:complete len:81 (-) Transcript_49603:177-419(-)
MTKIATATVTATVSTIGTVIVDLMEAVIGKNGNARTVTTEIGIDDTTTLMGETRIAIEIEDLRPTEMLTEIVIEIDMAID